MEDDVLEQPALPDSGDAGSTAADNNNAADAHDINDDLDPASQEQAEEEDEEIEVDGKKYALPKSAAEKLKSERMLNADYTQKTQAVAERGRQLDTREAEVTRNREEAQKYIDDIADVRSIDSRLALYKTVNWADLIDRDPQTAMLYQQEQRDLEAQRNEKVQNITQKQQANALSAQQNFAKQVQEADAYFKREIPGWTNERSNRVQEFAISQGISADELTQAVVRQPALAKLLHKAELFDQLEKKQAAAKPKPLVQDKPVTRISATRQSVRRDPAKMSDAEWMKQRQEQQRKR